MRKDIAKLLEIKARDIAKNFSLEDRDKNHDKEIFSVNRILPLSEFVAIVEFIKEPTKKKSIACLFWINQGEGYWMYFFPTDSHLLGMRYIEKYKQAIEVENFDKN